MLRVLVVGVVLVGCSSAPAPQPPAQVPAPEPVRPAAVEEPAPRSVRDAGGGRCEPEPRVGTPCLAGDGYCVLSWGEPGGHSTALWCRAGRWELESEVNLPADEG